MARKKKIVEIEEVQDSAPAADDTSGTATASATPVVPDPAPVASDPAPVAAPVIPQVQPTAPTPKSAPSPSTRAYADLNAGFADGSTLRDGTDVAGSTYATEVGIANDGNPLTVVNDSSAAYFCEQALDPYERANSGVVIP